MFFLRCAFWLSFVYSSMTWANTSFAPHDIGTQALDAGRTVATTVVARAVAGATDLCAQRPDACLTDAARLTSLFAGAGSAQAAPERTVATGEPNAVPLPIPDPRRHGRAAKLARAP